MKSGKDRSTDNGPLVRAHPDLAMDDATVLFQGPHQGNGRQGHRISLRSFRFHRHGNKLQVEVLCGHGMFRHVRVLVRELNAQAPVAQFIHLRRFAIRELDDSPVPDQFLELSGSSARIDQPFCSVQNHETLGRGRNRTVEVTWTGDDRPDKVGLGGLKALRSVGHFSDKLVQKPACLRLDCC